MTPDAGIPAVWPVRAASFSEAGSRISLAAARHFS